MKSPAHDYSSLMASIAVPGAEQAIEFYAKAFGATERYRLTDSTNGNIGYAELSLNDSLIIISEEMPRWNKSPETLGGTTVRFVLLVENADETFERAIAAGATPLMPVADQFYGYRSGNVRDPFGHEWMIQHLVEEVSPAEMQRRWDSMGNDCQASGFTPLGPRVCDSHL